METDLGIFTSGSDFDYQWIVGIGDLGRQARLERRLFELMPQAILSASGSVAVFSLDNQWVVAHAAQSGRLDPHGRRIAEYGVLLPESQDGLFLAGMADALVSELLRARGREVERALQGPRASRRLRITVSDDARSTVEESWSMPVRRSATEVLAAGFSIGVPAVHTILELVAPIAASRVGPECAFGVGLDSRKVVLEGGWLFADSTVATVTFYGKGGRHASIDDLLNAGPSGLTSRISPAIGGSRQFANVPYIDPSSGMVWDRAALRQPSTGRSPDFLGRIFGSRPMGGTREYRGVRHRVLLLTLSLSTDVSLMWESLLREIDICGEMARVEIVREWRRRLSVLGEVTIVELQTAKAESAATSLRELRELLDGYLANLETR